MNGSLGDDRRDWLRLCGGLMFGSGALVLLARKGQDWSDWAIFIGLLIPAAVLLGLAIVDRVPSGGQGWQLGFLVFRKHLARESHAGGGRDARQRFAYTRYGDDLKSVAFQCYL